MTREKLTRGVLGQILTKAGEHLLSDVPATPVSTAAAAYDAGRSTLVEHNVGRRVAEYANHVGFEPRAFGPAPFRWVRPSFWSAVIRRNHVLEAAQVIERQRVEDMASQIEAKAAEATVAVLSTKAAERVLSTRAADEVARNITFDTNGLFSTTDK